ncbi:MAG TPA: hypothetical protein VKW08_28110 [Xanthobacteraceae bacterium]|nr:hypothetical protein [Xanthobacteraceae bacterium]
MAEKIQPEARVFDAKTRFQKLARRPGGVPRTQAVENAQNQVEEAKLGFEDWFEGELTELVGWIERAKSGEGVEEWLEAAEFHAHQLRDVGTTVGFELLTFIAGTLCTILDGIKAGAEINMESIICHIDSLLLIRQKQYRNLRPDQVPELSRGLFRVAESVSIVPKAGQS